MLWSYSDLINVFKGVSNDILKLDAKFPFDQLPSMRDILELQARETEAGEEESFECRTDSSEVATLPSSPKGTTPSSSVKGMVPPFSPKGPPLA